ncbi:DUF5107 domain-containing protein [Vagococcus sp. BWB3-3]|uniref:DUF5107 domain-containing protein n=1 Tax=Vagococcus allomyrinae TaxID=2794353 RepID=A0A940SW13_9ENTE|nr:DUF5107 domain-containing protein [Vagococcus allomyrinae]MBP1040903.1 DUF5107 domain-containing protein [Vagococcus allomyrinae]
MSENVKVWEETIIMPTYQTSEPDKNPLFFEKRVYQGSSGKVYPHGMTERIMDEKIDVAYPAVMLENQYLKVVILPTLGGRIQRAYDKTNDYDFVYYNQVIKPALVGLIGPWISGGIEFNWPQHHRPSTYMPTEYEISYNDDGSKTVWVSEVDKMYGTKGMAGFTLYPDSAYIEITGKVYNRTDTPQTFLWWANPAVPANDHTVSIFPPDVHAVMDHGKRAVSDFPIATGTYYKYDYSAGVDISRYKNIEVPTSYMAYHSDYDFIGNYDEEKKAGLLHVANHHISPGKKQWVWGNSDFGLSWDRNLTDEDGPYTELMTGVFTDNQPDFTWLKPYEEKEFKQYFMPYKGVGHVKNATIEAAVNLEIEGDCLKLVVYGTKARKQVNVIVSHLGKYLYEKEIDLSPFSYFEDSFKTSLTKINEDVSITVCDQKGQILVSYRGMKDQLQALPEPAEALLPPEELKSTEELFLAATHIEQYRHATLEAEAYYLEGLKRDQTDIRLNNGYGVFLFKRGLFQESESYLQKAVTKQKWKTPNPYYGEPSFNLGLVQVELGKAEESVNHFYKATWSEDTQSAAFYQLACHEAKLKHFHEAITLIDKCLVKNQHHMKARVLKIALLRQLGNETTDLLKANFVVDPLDLGSHYEHFKEGHQEKWQQVMRGELNNYLELAWDYLSWGLLDEALEILEKAPSSPLTAYYQGYVYHQQGYEQMAKEAVLRGESLCPDYCFPNKLAEIKVLELAINLLPEQTSFARYYLGNLFYDKKRYQEAIELWEASMKLNPLYPTVYRNLSFGYYNNYDQIKLAESMLKQAFELDSTDARVLMELELVMKRRGASVEERIDLLEKHLTVTEQRDDLYIVYISLLNNQGKHQKALSCLKSRQFHPWEGGEGKVSGQYIFALVEEAKKLLTCDPTKAIDLLSHSQSFPHSLGEGKLPNAQDNISDYFIAKAYEAMGNQEQANSYYQKASVGVSQPESVLYYYDQPADSILYKGLALAALGRMKEAKSCFHGLIRYGELHLFDVITYDYFAVSLPETVVFKRDLQEENQLYCEYLMGLGNLGLNNHQEASDYFLSVLEQDGSHQGAKQHLAMIDRG